MATKVRLPYGSSEVEFAVETGVYSEAGVAVEVKELASAARTGETARKAEKERERRLEILREALKRPLKAKTLREILRERFSERRKTAETAETAWNAEKGRGEKGEGGRGGEEGAEVGREIVIVVDDHTRSAPTEEMLDALTAEISEAGGEEYLRRVKVLVACGTHSAPSEEELRRILGKHYGRFPVETHDCDADSLVFVGRTSRGTPVFLNATYVNAKMRGGVCVLTGDITLHYYAGFGGGRKSILPGIAGRETIRRNHALLVHENARTANLDGNPVHEDMCEAAAMPLAKPDFVLNAVSDASGNLVAAFAGECDEVFKRGAAVARELFVKRIREKYDILVVSAGGFPKDRNLYLATKAIEHCKRAVADGGSLILVAECRDGVGDAVFEDWMNKYKTAEAVESAVKTNFVLGGHKAFYLRSTMRRIRICVVSSLDAEMLENWGIQPYESVQSAVECELNLMLRHKEKKMEEEDEGEREEGGKGAEREKSVGELEKACERRIKIGVVRNGMDVFLE